MEQKKRLPSSSYVIAGLSFIPLIGVLFGLVAVIWGLATNRGGGKKLALIGGAGIAFTVVIYSALFYFGFVQRGGIYDKLRTQMSLSNLESLVQSIEYYKLQEGKYPDSLETLAKSLPKDSFVFINDPASFGPSMREYYYQLRDENRYYLLGVGPDGKPFTADDVVPEIKPEAGSKIGLITK